MPRKWINEETPISIAIQKKGNKAKKLIEQILCDGEKICSEKCPEEKHEEDGCSGTRLTLKAAAMLKNKEDWLITLITKLNNIPNIPIKR